MNGHALFGRPLEERQHILQELRAALASDAVKLTESSPATQSRRLMEACAAMGLEGVIMKRKWSLYRPGYCSPDWIKVPIRYTEEFIVMGHLAALHRAGLLLVPLGPTPRSSSVTGWTTSPLTATARRRVQRWACL